MTISVQLIATLRDGGGGGAMDPVEASGNQGI